MRRLALCALPLLTSCREHDSFSTETIEEIFCDGKTITAIAKIEDIETSRFIIEHGSGRHDQVTQWSGVVRWNLPTALERSTQEPFSIVAFPSVQARAADESSAHVQPVGARAFSGLDTILDVDSDRGALTLRRAEGSATEQIAALDIDPVRMFDDDVLPTRSS